MEVKAYETLLGPMGLVIQEFAKQQRKLNEENRTLKQQSSKPEFNP